MERLTTGDFIGFSCLDTVRVEVVTELVMFRPGERALSLRHTVGNSCRIGTLLIAPTIDALTGSAEINDLSHMWPSTPNLGAQGPFPTP
jgi:hypothetical protein